MTRIAWIRQAEAPSRLRVECYDCVFLLRDWDCFRSGCVAVRVKRLVLRWGGGRLGGGNGWGVRWRLSRGRERMCSSGGRELARKQSELGTFGWLKWVVFVRDNGEGRSLVSIS